MSTEDKKTSWKNGYWFTTGQRGLLYNVNDKKAECKNLVCLDYPSAKKFMSGTWSYGDFGPAPEEISEATGIKNHNIMMDYGAYKFPGVLSQDGTVIHGAGLTPACQVYNWISEEQLEAVKEDREPADAPSFPAYIKPQPEKPGKLVWFSGPPGDGKSTTAQLLAKNHGYAVSYTHLTLPTKA